MTLSMSAANATESVRIGVGDWIPYQQQSAEHYGGAHRIITEAFALEGIETTYAWIPWKRALLDSKNGYLDGAALAQRTSEKEQFYYYSDPVMSVKKVFFHLKSYQFDWNNYDDLKGLSVGTRIEFIYGDEFHQAQQAGVFSTKEVETDRQNVNMLFTKRVQIIATELGAGRHFLHAEFPAQEELVTFHPRPIQAVTYHVIFSKKVAGNKDKRDRFNQGLKILKNSGKIKQYLLDAEQGKYSKQ
jgi:polar amino acid transport system substrate-binding protein